MALVRTRRNTGTWLTDETLSWEARGLLAYLFERPEDWEIRMEALVQAGPCEESALRRILTELEERGYAVREKKRQYDGTHQWVTELRARPAGDVSAPSVNGRAEA